jgi:hypothetical protein
LLNGLKTQQAVGGNKRQQRKKFGRNFHHIFIDKVTLFQLNRRIPDGPCGDLFEAGLSNQFF